MVESNDTERLKLIFPRNCDELLDIVSKIAKTDLFLREHPGTLQDRIESMTTVVYMGNAFELHPLVSLKNIYKKEGQLLMRGDLQLAVVERSGKLANKDFFYEGTYPEDDFKAVFVVRRKNKTKEKRTEFSIADAKEAGLWDTESWSRHPKRCLYYKAMDFALRDNFSDIILGVHSLESMAGENINKTTTKDPNPVLLNELCIEINKIQTFDLLVFQEKIDDIMTTARTNLTDPEITNIKDVVMTKMDQLNAK